MWKKTIIPKGIIEKQEMADAVNLISINPLPDSNGGIIFRAKWGDKDKIIKISQIFNTNVSKKPIKQTGTSGRPTWQTSLARQDCIRNIFDDIVIWSLLSDETKRDIDFSKRGISSEEKHGRTQLAYIGRDYDLNLVKIGKSVHNGEVRLCEFSGSYGHETEYYRLVYQFKTTDITEEYLRSKFSEELVPGHKDLFYYKGIVKTFIEALLAKK